MRHVVSLQRGYQTFSGQILTIIGSMFPAVIESAKIFQLRSSDSSATPSDLQEQILIALLWDGSMNMQFEGLEMHSHCTEDDAVAFLSLRTNLIQQIVDNGQIFTSIDHEAENYAHQLQTYYKSQPELLKKIKTSFSSAVLEVVATQCTAQCFDSGASLGLIVGTDPTADGFKHPSPFLTGSCTSGKLVSYLLKSLAEIEQGARIASDSIPAINDVLLRNHHLQFIDLWPWSFKRDCDLEALMPMHHNLVANNKLLPIMPSGITTTKAVRKDFATPENAGKYDPSYDLVQVEHRFQEVAGDMVVRKLHKTDQWFIALPCSHPGGCQR